MDDMIFKIDTGAGVSVTADNKPESPLPAFDFTIVARGENGRRKMLLAIATACREIPEDELLIWIRAFKNGR